MNFKPLEKSAFIQLLIKKGLAPSAFGLSEIKSIHVEMKVDYDIAHHADWAYKHIYSIPMINEAKREEKGMARLHHGIQHTSRATYFVPVLANLYRRHGDEEAKELTPEKIKLIQIAVLFHDAARENDGKDIWDEESAQIFYYYATHVLNYSHEEVTEIAEAMAKKEAEGKKNIFQKLIHDADCLDIIRVRNHFDATYLDFFKQFVVMLPDEYSDEFKMNTTALNEMAKLITEVRSVTELQGDSYNRINHGIKRKYETENCYPLLKESIRPDWHPMLSRLGNRLLSEDELQSFGLPQFEYDKEQGLTEEYLQFLLNAGLLFARGVPKPSVFCDETPERLIRKVYETSAAREIRKKERRPDIPTRTSKVDENGKKPPKDGNPNRSISMLGWGSATFCSAGFLIIDPDEKEITKVSSVNCFSGTGKKQKFNEKQKNTSSSDSIPVKTKLHQLNYKQKLGGDSIHEITSKVDKVLTHSEVVYRIRDFNAIFYSLDYNSFDERIPHPAASKLQAYYLQRQHQLLTGRILPIFEYSGIHNYIKATPELKKNEIKALWVELCSAYITQELNNSCTNIYRDSIEAIKVQSMYPNAQSRDEKLSIAADNNYDEEFRLEINVAIENTRKELLSAHTEELRRKIQAQTDIIFLPEIFFNLASNSELLKYFKNKIHQEIKREVKGAAFFHEFKSVNDFSFDIDFEKCGFGSFKLESLEKSARKQLYNQKVAKIYELAKRLELKEELIIIQNKAIHLFKKEMKNFKSVTFKEPSHIIKTLDQLKNLFIFVQTFDLRPLVEAELFDNMNTLVKKASEHLKKDFDELPQFILLIEFLKKAKLFNVVVKKSAIDTLNLIIKKLGKNTESTLIVRYLQLANVLDSPIQERKKIFLTWLKDASKFTFHGRNIVMINAVGSSGLLNDDEVFSQIINKIDPRPYFSDCAQPFDLERVVKCINAFKAHLPNEKFTPKQLMIIQNYFKKFKIDVPKEFIEIPEQKMGFFASSPAKALLAIPKNNSLILAELKTLST